MADLSQNTALVAPGSGAQYYGGQLAGIAFDVGMPVYQNNTNSYWYQAQSGGTALRSGGMTKIGIALSTADGIGQSINIFYSGLINLGATLVVGQTYVLSANNGKVAPVSDLATNNYVTVLGVAVNASHLRTPDGGIFATNTLRA